MINNERFQFSTASSSLLYLCRRNITLYYSNSVAFHIHLAKTQVTMLKSVQSVKNEPIPTLKNQMSFLSSSSGLIELRFKAGSVCYSQKNYYLSYLSL